MTNIGAINSKHTKIYGVTKKSWIAMKICDTLFLNSMPCHHHMEDWVDINYHHMEDLVDINCKEQQYFQLFNK
jgi:hypothetical protein